MEKNVLSKMLKTKCDYPSLDDMDICPSHHDTLHTKFENLTDLREQTK